MLFQIGYILLPQNNGKNALLHFRNSLKMRGSRQMPMQTWSLGSLPTGIKLNAITLNAYLPTARISCIGENICRGSQGNTRKTNVAARISPQMMTVCRYFVYPCRPFSKAGCLPRFPVFKINGRILCV